MPANPANAELQSRMPAGRPQFSRQRKKGARRPLIRALAPGNEIFKPPAATEANPLATKRVSRILAGSGYQVETNSCPPLEQRRGVHQARSKQLRPLGLPERQARRQRETERLAGKHDMTVPVIHS